MYHRQNKRSTPLLLWIGCSVALFRQTSGTIDHNNYSPANGYFVCPKSGMICTVVGCATADDNDNDDVGGGGGCSIVTNGFEKQSSVVSTDSSVQTYTSTVPYANLSITTISNNDTVTDTIATEIACDAACDCQLVVAGLEACTVATVTTTTTTSVNGIDSATATGNLAGGGDGIVIVNGQGGDESVELQWLIIGLFAGLAALVASMLLGFVWYRKQNKKCSDENFDSSSKTNKDSII